MIRYQSSSMNIFVLRKEGGTREANTLLNWPRLIVPKCVPISWSVGENIRWHFSKHMCTFSGCRLIDTEERNHLVHHYLGRRVCFWWWCRCRVFCFNQTLINTEWPIAGANWLMMCTGHHHHYHDRLSLIKLIVPQSIESNLLTHSCFGTSGTVSPATTAHSSNHITGQLQYWLWDCLGVRECGQIKCARPESGVLPNQTLAE